MNKVLAVDTYKPHLIYRIIHKYEHLANLNRSVIAFVYTVVAFIVIFVQFGAIPLTSTTCVAFIIAWFFGYHFSKLVMSDNDIKLLINIMRRIW